MSKTVAASYLEKVAEVSATVTVYFTDEGHLSRFLAAAKKAHGEKLSCSRGFDYVVFMSADHATVRDIQAKAKETGLDYSGV